MKGSPEVENDRGVCGLVRLRCAERTIPQLPVTSRWFPRTPPVHTIAQQITHRSARRTENMNQKDRNGSGATPRRKYDETHGCPTKRVFGFRR